MTCETRPASAEHGYRSTHHRRPLPGGKKHIGGFTIIQAPDLDAALEWGRRLARAIMLPIEVRTLQDGTC
jgi:hypothetical protein